MKHKLAMLSLVVAVGHSSCTSYKEKEESPTRFVVTSPLQKDTLVVKDYVCQVHAIQHIELRAQERGYLEKIYVDEGQFVKAGQLLFQIMPKVYEAELKKAQAEAHAAEIELQNTKVLADKNVVSATELALAKAKLERAKAEVALHKVHLGFTQIRAPFDGIIDRFHVRQGSLVGEGELLTEFSDNSKMWVYYNVPEAEYLDYKIRGDHGEKQIVNLLLANNRPFEYSGLVETIEGDFDNETGNIAFRATFPNPKGLLRHGETGNIQVKVPFHNAVIIPQKASFEIMDKKYVYVVTNDHHVKLREIAVAAEMPDLYVLAKGLKSDEKILLEGIRKVKESDKIDYTFIDPGKAVDELKLHAE